MYKDIEQRRKYLREYMRERYAEDPEKAIKYKRDYNNAHPKKKFRWQTISHLRRDGVSDSEIERALKRWYSLKKKKCPICEVKETKKIKPKWNFDHCHASKIFRDIICWKCNSALGLVNDNIKTLERMIKYLKKFYAVAEKTR